MMHPARTMNSLHGLEWMGMISHQGLKVWWMLVGQVQPFSSVGLLAILSVGRLRASAALHAAASALDLCYELLTQQPAQGQPCEVLPNWELREPHAAGVPLNLRMPPMPPPRCDRNHAHPPPCLLPSMIGTYHPHALK